MGYGATSAPTIQTGNPQWDRNLGGLAGIFGNPGGYQRGLAAGASARESLLKGDASISERNAAILLARSLQQMDQTGVPVMPQQPTYRPSGVVGGAPIMEQPGGLQTSTGQPTPPPPQAQQQQPGLLARIFGSGNQQTPPAASPAPNAGAPAAPNTTGSDGSVPANSGPPDRTFNTTGGGQHYAPAANPDGSPRPPPLNLATYMGLAALAGQNPQMAQQTLSAIIAGGFEHGIIPWHTANSAMGGQGQSATQLAALIGNNAPYQSVQGTIQNAATNATTIQRENIQQAGETQRTGMTIADNQFRYLGTAQPGLVTRDADGNPIVNLPPTQTGGPLRPQGPGYSEQLTQQQRAADNVPVPYTTTTGQKAITTYGEYKKNPSAYNVLPKDMDELRTAITTAATAAGGGTPAALRSATIATTPPVIRDEAAAKANDAMIDTHMQRRFAPSETAFKDWNLTRGEQALIGDDTRAAVRTRADELVSQGVVRNPDAAVDQAIDELTQSGHIQTPQQIQTNRGRGMQMANPNVRTMQNNKGATVKVFHVPLEKPYEPGAVKLAPKDAPDGTPSKDGKYVVHNGFWYPR